MKLRGLRASEPSESLSEGLSPLDEQRAESMASEGGRSAQLLETARPVRPSLLPLGSGRTLWIALSLGLLGGFLAYRSVRRGR